MQGNEDVRNRKVIAIGCAVVVLVILLCGILSNLFWDGAGKRRAPTLTVETPHRISRSETETFTLEVTVSSLGDALYPAASMSIAFDSSRLEFLGVEEGTLFIKSSSGGAGASRMELQHSRMQSIRAHQRDVSGYDGRQKCIYG